MPKIAQVVSANDGAATPPTFSRRQQSIGFICWLLFCFLPTGAAWFFPVNGWFASLTKPTWNPPGWLFGPVWTMLYFLMALAVWLVWRQRQWITRRPLFAAFFVQWLLNALWTPLFFGAHRPDLAFIDIVALWIAIATTIVLFWRAHRIAALLLVPYLAWVSFASALNFSIWQLNS